MAEPSQRPKRARTGTTVGESSSAPPRNVSGLDLTRHFSTTKRAELFRKNFQLRKLISPRYLTPSFCTSEPLQCFQLLERLGLLGFLSIQKAIYPNLVRVFYANLKYEDHCLISEVRKTQIRITRDDWCHLTKLVYDGTSFYGNENAWGEDFEYKTALTSLIRSGYTLPRNNKRVMATGLTMENRVLHYLVVRGLIPRGGNYSQVLRDDVVVLWAMTTDRPINWANYIIQHMLDVKKKKNSALPYAMLITAILEHCCISLAEESKDTSSKGPQSIGLHTLRKLQLRKVDGRWHYLVHGSYGHISHGPESDDDEDEDQQPAPAPPASASLELLLQEMRSLATTVETRMDRIEQKVDHLELRMDYSDQELAAIRSHLEDSRHAAPSTSTAPPAAPLSYADPSVTPAGVPADNEELLGSEDDLNTGDDDVDLGDVAADVESDSEAMDSDHGPLP